MATTETQLETFKHYIGGEWAEPADGETFESVNPSTGEPWYRAARGTAEDVDRAVRAARGALDDPRWRDLTQTQRGRLLRRLADLIAEHAETLALAEATDNGKLIREMRGQLAVLPEWYHYFAGLADKIQGDVIPALRRRDPELHAARADRRRRRDHALELAAAPDLDEARAGARDGQHDRRQARPSTPRHRCSR